MGARGRGSWPMIGGVRSPWEEGGEPGNGSPLQRTAHRDLYGAGEAGGV